MAHKLQLGMGFTFEQLYKVDGLAAIDQAFIAYLAEADAALHNRLVTGRADPSALEHKEESALIVDAAPHVEDFIGRLFGISGEISAMQARHNELAAIYTVKRLFVQRRAIKGVSAEEAEEIDGAVVTAELEKLFGEPITELSYAKHVQNWLDNDGDEAALDLAARYAAWATLSQAGKASHKSWVLFRVPHKLDASHLVPIETEVIDGVAQARLPKDRWRHREGFALTDHGMDMRGALDQANYCIWCHPQGKDSCSTGLKDKETGAFKGSAFGVPLNGCPLEEKISEMNLTKTRGFVVGAIAIATVDNPMCAGTGHRICNDCMKSCIYQKQEPVDIPQIETETLKDLLSLPWGFEIYSLFTRWSPLNLRRPVPKVSTGYKVLVVGLGPAGYTLSHHLMNDGHTVIAVDGLKIEPLDPALSGVDKYGSRVPFEPVFDVKSLIEPLESRTSAGFGGVAEYGITVRWDKNFLKMIRLLLERRSQFTMIGGVRFGGTIGIDKAFELGFDHIALCAGAGRPTVIPMKNGLAPGVRQASDFLMALQLTGAAKADSIANLQIRLPVVVIGGGLTAIDAATEALAYYPVQVEKFVTRYETLIAEHGEAGVRGIWTPHEQEVADEFIAHAKAIRDERKLAHAAGLKPRIADLLDQWGGVVIAYRRRLIDAPSYTLNHEEVALAMQEGIRFAEGLTPEEVKVDHYGVAEALVVSRHSKDAATGEAVVEKLTLPARSVIVAAGTQPNTVLGREDPLNVVLDGRYFQAYGEDGTPVHPEKSCKPNTVHVLMSARPDGRSVSFFGDLHPSFAGNVVKAMASAKLGYPVVSRQMAATAHTPVTPEALAATMNEGLRATVRSVERLTPTIVEVTVHAPFAARAFMPGQFYRLQNFEALAPRADGTTLMMEGLALTGASVDKYQGLLSTIVLEMGGSSDLCAHLQPGEPVILMGPTGEPTETPHEETVLLVGGGLGNAVLFSIGQALRASGSKVIYIAGYKRLIDRYKIEEIERAADVIVWCSDEAPGFKPTRPQDMSTVCNIVEAIEAYGSGKLGKPSIPLDQVDRIIAIGSDGMMNAVAKARHGVLKPLLKPSHCAIGSINSPMQCAMKEICGQCLQLHRDPETGAETVVFSCFNQDQPLDKVDFASLRQRLSQNGVQEKLTKMWIDRSLRQLGWRAVAAE
ncbi:FAD-dependent oxidoreductase [Methyloferula stellata]|uniref:FAD-dependent oxidoreductase n=1 Tax=Methyloferula stellata TaxID=876270 RepID=UPI0003798B4A|nr:FAD-dependent oxidoreductase [Methyloferula stellata]